MNNEKLVGAGQDKALFLEFVQFCNAQPKDKEINHRYWSTCAIGEFSKTKGVEFKEGYILPSDKTFRKEIDFIESLTGEKYQCWDDTLINALADRRTETYGEFTDFLKSYLPTINEIV